MKRTNSATFQHVIRFAVCLFQADTGQAVMLRAMGDGPRVISAAFAIDKSASADDRAPPLYLLAENTVCFAVVFLLLRCCSLAVDEHHKWSEADLLRKALLRIS